MAKLKEEGRDLLIENFSKYMAKKCQKDHEGNFFENKIYQKIIDVRKPQNRWQKEKMKRDKR